MRQRHVLGHSSLDALLIASVRLLVLLGLAGVLRRRCLWCLWSLWCRLPWDGRSGCWILYLLRI